MFDGTSRDPPSSLPSWQQSTGQSVLPNWSRPGDFRYAPIFAGRSSPTSRQLEPASTTTTNEALTLPPTPPPPPSPIDRRVVLPTSVTMGFWDTITDLVEAATPWATADAEAPAAESKVRFSLLCGWTGSSEANLRRRDTEETGKMPTPQAGRIRGVWEGRKTVGRDILATHGLMAADLDPVRRRTQR